MSASSPQPAAPEAALRQAGDLGRRHGRAAVYWQIGDSGTAAAREFYQELLRGIASADPAITGLYEVPDLTGRWDYERGNLAADLQLADGGPALAQAAAAYLAAAREEFWLEAARLARRRLAPSAGDETGDADEDGTEPENTGDGEPAPDWRQDITDPATGLSRLLSERCPTCILRAGDPMHLGPERTAAFIRQVLDAGSYVVCHDTLTYGDFPDYGPAICRGFFDAYHYTPTCGKSRKQSRKPPRPAAGRNATSPRTRSWNSSRTSEPKPPNYAVRDGPGTPVTRAVTASSA